ncbi:MAG: hypothetical protein IID46_15015, partial [Planctomycetes bacterium]|nr:hypothetical protein [Planctomycetota bacterium]
MATLRRTLLLILLVLASAMCAWFAFVDDRPSTELPNTPSGDGLLTLRATVLMPDGSPAVGAIVKLIDFSGKSRHIAHADESGQIRLRDEFVGSTVIHASSVNGALQTTLVTSAAEARSVFATPIELTLALVVEQEVVVLSEGRPVAGARVMAKGAHYFRVYGVTGPEGRVKLRLPASEPLRELVAWHPKLGVAGTRGLEYGKQNVTQLTLLAPGVHKIRVVDAQGDPVSDLKLGVNVRTDE